jgi:hypothetical protein
MQLYENTIGGFFSRLGDDMNALAADVGNAASGVKSAWGSIKSGEAWKNIKAGAATAWEGVKGAASWVKDKAVSAWNGVKNVAASAWNSVAGAVSTAVGAVGTFAEKTGNWFSGDGFNTDDEVAEIQTRQRIQEAIRNGTALEEGSEEYKRIQAALNKEIHVGADPDSQARADEKMNSYRSSNPETANSRIVAIIKDKLLDGKNLSEEDLVAFFKSGRQQSKGDTALEKELIASIKNDPDAFQKAMKERGYNSANSDDVQKFSREIQGGFCVLFNEYAQMALNNVEGTSSSVGEFYKHLLNAKSSDGGNLIDVLNQKVSTQEIFDSVAGKGNVQVYGYGKDRNGKGFSDENGSDTIDYKGPAMLKKLKQLSMESDIDYFTVRIRAGGGFHDLTLKNENKNLRLYDNSWRGTNKNYSDYIKAK